MIEWNRVTLVYPDGTAALREFTCTIKQGETVALIGANGAGKSSLLLSAVGILLPTEGEIRVDGLTVSKKNSAALHERVGMVFQNPDDQLFMARVSDDVAFGLRNAGYAEEEVQARTDAVLEQLGITSLKDRSPSRMSGGQKRSAALASVLVMEPEVLLFDEPTSFLDPKARRNFMETLHTLEQTKVIATHDLDMALEACDRVITLREGELFADGTPQTVLTDAALLEACGLELPFCLAGNPFCRKTTD